ncbi:FtsB family cell division protein [Planococcus beigongshangi]|uniref:FtsB family cell division protein n=1 Tax=Planococcus beigongshangi TaxID=2782536 RepID=UPI00193C1CA8|nr:septum formation initiator family protein [Planococcus beigongshangi]
MSLKREKSTAAPEVASIQNDYVRSVERKEKRQMAHKVRLFRRLAVFGLVVMLATIWIGTTIYAQSQTLTEKEQLREEAQLALKDVKKEQVKLQEQIILLNDDEYLAKLAKKELFVSENGEIIFTLPEK